MKDMGLTLLDYKEESGVSVRMERAAESAQASDAPTGFSKESVAGYREGPASAGGSIFRSPMVGGFYAAPGADMEPYVIVGDTVRVGDVLCIIESMKIMNEMTAERDGVITEIFVENKQIVEFSQPLFRIDKVL